MQNIELEDELRPSAAAQPAKRPYEPGACTGNCKQGRACDCAPVVDDMDPPCRPMTRTDAGWLAVSYVFSAVAVVSAIAAVIQCAPTLIGALP